jgi:hypothetical protein
VRGRSSRIPGPPGQSVVRIIQASLKQAKVTVTWNGQQTVSGLAFGQVSSYQTVKAATATLHIAGASDSVTSTVTLAAGTVHTLVVLDGAKGLTLDDFTDAAGSGNAPLGGVKTGFGGTAPRDPAAAPWLYVIGAGLLLAAAGSLGLRRRPQQLST